MKPILVITLLSYFILPVAAQEQNFDIAHFATPKGWTEQKTEGHISYSHTNNGNWAQIIIYKSTASRGSIDTDFDNDWKELVTVNKTISSPKKNSTRSADGWKTLSGIGTWQYNHANVASVLTIYCNDQVYIPILCNTTDTAYLNDYQAMLASLVLNAENKQLNSGTINKPPNSGSPAVPDKNSIVGIWVVNQAETRGFINGFLIYSGGYMRKEYQIKEDGTYIFREKDWLANNETIYFVYESGTWTMNGNKLTITPEKGKAGWWGKDKITNDVNKWSHYQKAAPFKIQKVEYAVEVISDINYSNSIALNFSKATERDGGQFNNPPYRFVYVQRKETLIDNPPDFKF